MINYHDRHQVGKYLFLNRFIGNVHYNLKGRFHLAIPETQKQNKTKQNKTKQNKPKQKTRNVFLKKFKRQRNVFSDYIGIEINSRILS